MKKMSTMVRYLMVLLLATIAMANTETYMIRVPKYFDIPNHQSGFESVNIHPINETHKYIEHFPIVDKSNYLNAIPTIEINDPFHDKQHNTLLIKLNNYLNSTYDSNDILFVKLCWPAIYPVHFQLDHQFIHTNELIKGQNSFDMYLQVDMKWDFKTYHHDYETVPGVKFKLVVEKLPNQWIPVPLEVYDIIVYLVDMVIILRQLFKYLSI